MVHATHEGEPIALVEDGPTTHSTHPNHQSGAIAVNTGATGPSSNGGSHAPASTPSPATAPAASAAHGDAHMEYHVMINQSLYLLETAVNRHIKEGWEPTGGLTVGMSNNAMQFFQALIRRKKPAV
jgi:hypothetical protein